MSHGGGARGGHHHGDGGPQAELHALIGAIARDAATASRLLSASPGLAVMVVDEGATRTHAKEHYLAEIGHYVYAGDTPLHVAAAAHRPGLTEDLLSKGADSRARNRRGAEPLHYAADGAPGSPGWNPDGQTAVVEILIRSGADPDSEDSSGVTPLHRAVRTRCAAAVQALLAGGADALKRNRGGSTPLHLAIETTGRGGSGSEAARDQQAEIVRLLLRHGGRASDRNAAGRSVTDCARSDWLRALLRDP